MSNPAETAEKTTLDNLQAAFEAVEAIVKAERVRRDRRHGMFDFVRALLEEEPKL